MQSLVATLLLAGLVTVNGTPVSTAKMPFSTSVPGGRDNATVQDIRSSLPVNALEIEHKFHPVLDYDGDGCYNTAAIDASGNQNPGLSYAQGTPPSCLRAQCRDANRLENNNVYSRSRCNNGWCAIMYEYYFEKDQIVCGSFAGGHRHDWENIVVFTQGETVKRVAPSCHGNYDGATSSPRLQGQHAKVVYHKDGGRTHCFRMANEADENIENYTGQWFLGRLVGWTGWPSVELRTKGMSWTGDAQPKLPDDKFADNLRKAAGGQVPGFDPDLDE